MGESDAETTKKAPKQHDWTLFVFIAVALILTAAAISWASAKAGLFGENGEGDLDTTVINRTR